MAISLPTAAQAAAQTPSNTFSPTSTPLQNTANSLTYSYNPSLGVWTSAATGSGLAAASLAEAAAGVLTSVYSSPETSVPKNASGMTGSAFIPAGNTAARPAANAYTGQFRYNTQIPQLEYSDGSSWVAVVSVVANSINNLLPSQSGNNGEFLTTDGTNVSWAPINAGVPSGTVMLFAQAAAPTGWTQVTTATYNDAAIRLVTGAGAGTGGTIGFTTLFSPTSSYTGSVTITSGTVGATTLSTAQLASHSHTYITSGSGGGGGIGQVAAGFVLDPGVIQNTGGNATHTHSLTGVVAGGTFTSDFAVKYVNMIVATKN